MTGGPQQDALSSEVYERAFTKLMAGTDLALLSEEERQAVAAAQEQAGQTGQSYPLPASMTPKHGTGEEPHRG